MNTEGILSRYGNLRLGISRSTIHDHITSPYLIDWYLLNKLWISNFGLWIWNSEHWTLNDELCTSSFGFWSSNFELWALDFDHCELWTMYFVLRALDFDLWNLSFGHWSLDFELWPQKKVYIFSSLKGLLNWIAQKGTKWNGNSRPLRSRSV